MGRAQLSKKKERKGLDGMGRLTFMGFFSVTPPEPMFQAHSRNREGHGPGHTGGKQTEWCTCHTVISSFFCYSGLKNSFFIISTGKDKLIWSIRKAGKPHATDLFRRSCVRIPFLSRLHHGWRKGRSCEMSRLDTRVISGSEKGRTSRPFDTKQDGISPFSAQVTPNGNYSAIATHRASDRSVS